MVDTEEYFPRGGKKPTVQHFKQSSNFLGAPEKSEKKKKKPKKKSEGDDGYLSDEASKDLEKYQTSCASGLSYKTVKPGVLILGRVRQVQETRIEVSLPSCMLGKVMACHVSEPYNKLLEAYVNDKVDHVQELSSMFRPGQYVATKVLEVEDRNLLLSMMPQHINSGKTAADLKGGCILQAAVSSVEDHGYVMDLGVPDVRAFLPKKHANPEIELDTGALTWVTVKSSSSSEGGVITLSSHLDALQKAILHKSPTSLLPASHVLFTVDTPLPNGIAGHIFAERAAFVQRHHALPTHKDKRKPTLGQRVPAHVLYVMPTRNTPFLTLRNIFQSSFPDLQDEQKFQEGDIVDNAQVLKISGRSIHFKLGPGSVGSMSLKRVAVEEDLTDEEVIAKSYPVGSTHRVRILCYNLSDYMYSVSDRASVLSERYFSLRQLTPGQLVSATVSAVADTHMILTVGRMTGYVPHVHMSDAGIFVDPKKATTSKLPKKKFKVGQEITARVLSVDVNKPGLYLTVKPSLLQHDVEVLSAHAQADVGKAYRGVIQHIRPHYVVVSFFNNVSAFVPRQYVTRDTSVALPDAFHQGEIVNCTILRVDAEGKKMTGSLITEPFWPAPKREPKKRKQKDGIDKITDSENSETPKKKKKKDKTNEEQEAHDETDKKTKKNKKQESNDGNSKVKKSKKTSESNEECEDVGESKKTKNNKKQLNHEKNISNKNDVSEESDAIETDMYESDQALSPQDLALIDLTDCKTARQYKKRIVTLLKSIKARTRRVDRINGKINSIEEKGLDKRSKKYHNAMQVEKYLIEQRVEKLLAALKTAQEKLKEFPEEENTEYKNKQEKKQKKSQQSDSNDEIKKKTSKETDVFKNNKDSQRNRKTSEHTDLSDDNLKDTKKNKKVNDPSVDKRKIDVKNILVLEDSKPVLDVPSAKEFWSGDAANLVKDAPEDRSSSSDEEEEEQPKKKRKKLTVAEKVAKARAEEERLRDLERRAIESEAQPRSSDQFERALLAHPDCSQLWIAYMAFHLQATEIDKARNVGRKALNTINFREEQERLNVWLALLNCEHRFGTKESQQKTLEEALQTNDTYKVHSKLLDILVDTGKQQELSSLVDLMLRKYKRDPQNYIACGGACFKLGMVERARQVMQKAIAVLEKKEHVNVLVKFALMERAEGAAERAESLFEQVLAVYPQRTDVCCVYVDMLLKSGDRAAVRQVMERITSQKLPARKMKILYKKWIEVEEKLGDPSEVEKIRQKAMEFIDKAKF